MSGTGDFNYGGTTGVTGVTGVPGTSVWPGVTWPYEPPTPISWPPYTPAGVPVTSIGTYDAFSTFCRCPLGASIVIKHLTGDIYLKTVYRGSSDGERSLYIKGNVLDLTADVITALVDELQR